MKKKISFFLFFILIFTTSLLAGFSARAASGTCPTDNGSGVGCLDPSYPYYCGGVCRGGQTQCPSWTGTICADGVTCPANCAGADACGYCSSCASGYTLCGAYLTRTCTANTTAPANCTAYDQCTATCTACAQGYILTGGLCEGATLKLGSDSVGALNHIFQSTSPALSILSSGLAGLGTTTPTARLSVVPASGYSILAGDFKIGNVALPTESSDAATKGYIDSALSYMASTSTFWDGSIDGNIWSLNSGNVGIGTTNPGEYLLNVQGALTTEGTNQDLAYFNGSGSSFAGGLLLRSYYANATRGFAIQSRDKDTNSRALYLNPGGGNVGIGTTTPIQKLDVLGNIRANGVLQALQVGGSSYMFTMDAANGSGPRFQLGQLATPAGFFELGAWGNINNFDSKSRDLKFYNTAGIIYMQNSSGNVGIGTTTPTARLSVVPASGYSILAGNFKIGNVALPTEDADAATKGYVDSFVASATSSISNLWGGNVAGNIWSLNSGNVGIGTTNPLAKFVVNTVTNTDFEVRNGADYGTGYSGVAIDSRDDARSTRNMMIIAGSPVLMPFGNVGIGATNPIQKFEVQGSIAIAPSSKIGSGNASWGGSAGQGNGYLELYSASTGDTTLWNSSNFSMIFGVNNSEVMRLYAGKVGIGNTNPTSLLTVGSDTTTNVADILVQTGDTPANASLTLSSGGFISNLNSFGDDEMFSINVGGGNSMNFLSNGNIGIGTTTPTARLSVVPASGYSILAGNFKIGNVASPTEDSDVVTLGWVNSALSSIGSSAVYATSTVSTYNGSQGGYSGANALCAAVESGSHVCTTEEILYTINNGFGASIPAGTFWISNGPPAYTANANDCQGWTSASGSYGTAWVKLSSGDGFGSLYACSAVYKFACCE